MPDRGTKHEKKPEPSKLEILIDEALQAEAEVEQAWLASRFEFEAAIRTGVPVTIGQKISEAYLKYCTTYIKIGQLIVAEYPKGDKS